MGFSFTQNRTLDRQAVIKYHQQKKELYDFVNHGMSIIMPMLSRLKTCNDIIKMGTNGKVNLFEKTEYHSLSKML